MYRKGTLVVARGRLYTRVSQDDEALKAVLKMLCEDEIGDMDYCRTVLQKSPQYHRKHRKHCVVKLRPYLPLDEKDFDVERTGDRRFRGMSTPHVPRSRGYQLDPDAIVARIVQY